jgi:hypothetical protein
MKKDTDTVKPAVTPDPNPPLSYLHPTTIEPSFLSIWKEEEDGKGRRRRRR